MTPGMQISRYNEVGSYSGDQGGNVYIRGTGASRPGGEIKTYIDNVPVYMGLWNHPLMDMLPLNGMASIHILKGPQPQAGGNNFAAINMVSKRLAADGMNAQADLSAGSFGTRTLHAIIVGRQEGFDYLLAAGHVESDGDRANSDGKLDNAYGRLGFRLSEQWSVGLGFLSVDNEVGDPGDNRFAVSKTAIGPYSFSNGVARNRTDANLVYGTLAHRHGTWTGEIKLYENQGNNDLVNDPNWGSFDSHFVMKGYRWQEQLSPWQGGLLSFGLDRDTVSGRITGPHVGSAPGTPFAFGVAGTASIPEFRVQSTYLGLSHQFKLNAHWTLTPSVGVRRYDSNVYASKSSPQVGVTLATESLSLFGNATRGVLYPGAETYTLTRAIPMAFAANNGWDRLDPTEDDHVEIGFTWDVTADTHLDVSVFRDEIRKRYVWSGFFAGAFGPPPASGTWSNAFPDYRNRGIELALSHRFNADWSAFVGLTSLDSSIDTLPYAPKKAFSVGVNGRVAGARLTLDAQHQGDMYTLTQDRGPYTPNHVDGFTVANARIGIPLPLLGSKGEVHVALNNLFDRDYAYNAGYPMPGRNVRLGLSAGF
jgi:hypothetical protein